MNFLADVQARAAASVRRIVFPESADERTRAAVAELARRRLVTPIMVLDPAAPETHDAVRALGVEVRDPATDALAVSAADRLFRERERKGLTKDRSDAACSARRCSLPTPWSPTTRPTAASPAR